MVLDAVGSSETGAQMGHMSTKGTAVDRRRSQPGPGTVVVSEDLDRLLTPGDDERRLAGPGGLRAARLPRRRRQDGAHLPGHRRRPLLGARRPGAVAGRRRSSSCSAATRSPSTPAARRSSPRRSRQAIAHHPAVYDVIVVGRPSERWGQEVVALVQLADGRVGDRRGTAGRVRQAHRPVQVPQGVHLPARDRALPRRARPTTAGPKTSHRRAGRPDRPSGFPRERGR